MTAMALTAAALEQVVTCWCGEPIVPDSWDREVPATKDKWVTWLHVATGRRTHRSSIVYAAPASP